MNATSSSAGQDEGVINWPVGDTIKGPASLEHKKIEATLQSPEKKNITSLN